MSDLSTSIDSSDHLGWRELYLLALFEPDKKKAVNRIMIAERALVRRERQLFTNPSNSVEREEINRALQGLRALRTCVRRDTLALAA